MSTQPLRPFALLLACALLWVSVGARAQVPPDELLRGMNSEQRESLWNSMTPQQRRDFWQRLTPDQRQAIRNGIMSQSAPRPGPMMEGGGPPRRWSHPLPPGESAGVPVPPGSAEPPVGPRRWSPEDRQKLRDQIREWNRDAHGPHGGRRMGMDR